MKVSCKMISDLLPLYCDGVCSSESRQIVEQHLRECEKCREELRWMQNETAGAVIRKTERETAEAAAAAWKKGKKKSFLKGCLVMLLGIAVFAGCFTAAHWFSAADGTDREALARHAADYLGYETLSVVETAQRGDYLSVLCIDKNETWCMCMFDRDSLFETRWHPSGGIQSFASGRITSWNYGSPQGEIVLVFCGGSLSDRIAGYRFQNDGITYTCPTDQDGMLLDLFIIPDGTDLDGDVVLLDREGNEIEE